MRELNDDEDISNSSNQNDTLNANTESSTSTNSTERLISIENVSFKTFNSTKDSSKTNKKTKQSKMKSKKTRVNREILTTLLSRKKLYKMLQHKLEMYVRSKIVISIIGYSKILLILGLGLTEKSAY